MIHYFLSLAFFHLLQNALNAQRVAGLIKTAETMGILDTSTESTKQSDIDEILGFLAALEKVQIFNFDFSYHSLLCCTCVSTGYF